MKTQVNRQFLVCVATLGLLLSQSAILAHNAESLFDDHSHSSTNCSMHWFGESSNIGLSFPVLLDSQSIPELSSAFEYEWQDLVSRYQIKTIPRAPPLLKFSV